MHSFTPAVDTHAHVFDAGCRFVEGRRYTPGYEAPAARYVDMLDHAKVPYGVLVQPSFLGTDNSCLLTGLSRFHNRLRGIAVVAPAITDAELQAMAAAGVRGIRYNLVGLDPALISQPDTRALTRRVSALGWLVQVQAPGDALPGVLDTLTRDAETVIVDHFGKPSMPRPQDDPGFRKLMEFAPGDPVWVKLSAPYRLGGIDPGPYAAAFLAHFGPERLLWGSDWPWTENEAATSYGECTAQIGGWLGGDAGVRVRFNHASRALYGFPG